MKNDETLVLEMKRNIIAIHETESERSLGRDEPVDGKAIAPL